MLSRCKECRECGKELTLEQRHKGACFCCAPHRKTWNNRRMIRGAELYDLFMANRYEREWADGKNLLTLMSNQARAYRDADNALRDGRKSWNAQETLARIPLAYGTQGDRR